ncbi:S49 family peptidase [Paraburkholderia sediminicola]|uniref:S49 family peptidase n=1 Tax=Paraburkholderia sediminicola TaxID=458836 RepID=UPI0038B89EAD
MAALADRFGRARLFYPGGEVLMFGGAFDAGEPEQDRPYEVIEGIAIIPIQGTLVQKLGTLHPYSGMTGYNGIRANLALALADESVTAIAFDIDSPGGEVAGCFDLADAIYAARGIKPIWAVLTESAYSAAYALASACDRVTVPRTGGTGSVGVIVAHVDLSRALADAGLTVTLITYCERKADGNEFQPLADEAYDRIKADVGTVGELFVATVARNRGLSVAKVRGTQATTFLGAASVAAGFADAVMAPDAALRALLQALEQQPYAEA